ncbi:MAG: CoB-CoM heterodisulfide reductase HdrA2 [Archaeoglobaceae archaeon]|nr:CoB-CoM heterodisulfide reductase HdrA2 [Archaeoglobaceae archaeon]MDW7989602.1 CoB-CoM heterodisulfide reductase HdrA2 [Archaeoglobaceae archaeon]
MRIGVFVCHCGLNIARTVNVNEIISYAKRIPDVVYVENLDYACSDYAQEKIANAIKEYKLDGILVAACSPKLHESTFRRVAQRAGLNPYLVEIANIREQCSWVHQSKPKSATLKVRDLIRMHAAKLRKARPLEKLRLDIKKSVAVIGGGIAGIETALNLADMGIKVYLIERNPSIGGHMALLNEVFPTNDCSVCILAPKMSEVWNHEKIEVITNSEVEEVEGSAGNFKVKIIKHPRFVDVSKCKGCIDDCSSVCPVEILSEFDFGVGIRKAIYIPFPQSTPLYAAVDWQNCIGCKLCEKVCKPGALDFEQQTEKMEIEVGAIILATGYKLFDPRKKPEYGYGRFKNVITTMELERLLSASGPTRGKLLRPSDSSIPKRVAFILCVGSRDENTNRYCSRVCCMASMKNAYVIKDRHPDIDVTIFYIDIRAFGRMFEEFYKKVQSYGVRFIRGKVGEILEREDDGLTLSYENTLIGEVNSEDFDLVVLAVGIESDLEICKKLGIGVGEDGFVEIAHPKLRPVETNVRGIYVAGCVSGPKDIHDSIATAGLASAKAGKFILSGVTEIEPFYAFVDKEKCIGCRLCESVCNFKAVFFDKKAEINPKACVMCGICVSACPTDAIDMGFFSNEGIEAMIDALVEEKNADPLILVFTCWYCAYGALDLAGTLKTQYEPNIRVIRILCTGRVNPIWILKALEKGIDGVIVAGCRLGECHFKYGNYKAKDRVEMLKIALKAFGINPEKVECIWHSSGEGEAIARDINKFVEKIKNLKAF